MSLTYVQHFSISLDGFGTGEGQTKTAHFGHAGQRLHEWMFKARWGREMIGQSGDSGGVDDVFLQRFDRGIGAEIMGAGKFGHPGWEDARSGRARGVPTRRSTHRSSSSPITPARRSRWMAARRSTSSTPLPPRR